MTIDLSELPKEVNAPMNSGRSGGGSTVARLAFRYLLLPEGDANEGTFRPLKLILPEGTIVSARPTSPMGSYNSALPMLIDLVIRALAPAIPERVAAAHYGTFSTLAYAGRHPDGGAFWQCHDSGFGGWGALYDEDGAGPFRTNCHGDTRLIPIELHEASYPFMIESFSLRTDSGGPGEFRGGLGVERRYLMLAPARVSTRIERTICPAWGLNGGGDGAPGHAVIERARRHVAGDPQGRGDAQGGRPRPRPLRRRWRLRRSTAPRPRAAAHRRHARLCLAAGGARYLRTERLET